MDIEHKQPHCCLLGERTLKQLYVACPIAIEKIHIFGEEKL